LRRLGGLVGAGVREVGWLTHVLSVGGSFGPPSPTFLSARESGA
jgi:hypothetical protein